MEAQQAATILTSLIRIHDRVSLPGLGSFVAEFQPSRFMDQSRVLTPPLRVIRFSVSETWNDGRLESAYARELGDEIQAKQEVANLVYLIKKQVQLLGHFELPGLGLLRKGKKQLNFLKSLDCDLHSDGFGLSPLAIKPLTGASQVVWRSPKRGKNPASPRQQQREHRNLRLPKSVYITLGAVCLLVLILICLYLFRDSLRPVFEYLFYSAEERELLHSLR